MWKWTSANAPGQSLPSGIVRLQLDQGGARVFRQRIRRRHQLGLEGLLLAGQMQRRLDARRELAEKGLGNVDVNAHAVDVGDLKEGAPRRAAGVDEIADIDVARRHDAVERRLDLLKAGQLLEPADRGLLRHDIGLGDRHRGGAGGGGQVVGVALLLARPALRDELRGSLVRHLAEVGVRLRLLHRGLQLNQLPFRLFELLVEIGRRNRRQDLALRHMGADVLVPRGNIAARPSIKRAGDKRGDVARQHQVLIGGPALGPHQRTVGMVWALVQAATSCLLLARSMMPEAARPTAPIARTLTTSSDTVLFGLLAEWIQETSEGSGSGVGGQAGERLARVGFGFAGVSVHDREHGRHEQERRERRKQETADDGAPERRILPGLDGHRQHADDHGERRHQDRPEARGAGLERGLDRALAFRELFAREADDEDAVGRRHAHAHDRARSRRGRTRWCW